MNHDKNQASSEVGKTILFIGGEVKTQGWGLADIVAAAKRARALNIDTICVKRGEGTERWYSDIKAEKAAVNGVGCGYVPLWYCDGPRFGLDFVPKECDELKAILDAIGVVCPDLEVEWDGQLAAAQAFAAALASASGDLYLSTWADPVQQGWQQVTRALAPVVTAWVPQQYNDWLAAQQGQLIALGESVILPAVDLSQEFGTNHPVDIAQAAVSRGEWSCWMWEWVFAMGSLRGVAQSVVAAMSRATKPVPTPTPTPPPPAPTPAPEKHEYTIVEGDSLSTIAERLGVAEPTLFAENQQHLDETARRYGHQNSDNGNLIFPGDVITY